MPLFGQVELLAVAVLGVVLLAVSAMVWVGTQARAALMAMAAGVVVAAGAFVADFLWVTPAEQVEATLYRLAETLERNEPERVLEFLDSGNEALRKEVLNRLRAVQVESISIKSNLQVTVGVGRPPRSAESRFNAVAVVRDRRGASDQFTVPKLFEVRWVREGNEWRVASYTMHEPFRGLRQELP